MNETPLADAKDGVLEAVERGELIPVDLLGRQEFAPALPQTQVLLRRLASLLEAEVVTADGEVRIANACTNPDLACRVPG